MILQIQKCHTCHIHKLKLIIGSLFGDDCFENHGRNDSPYHFHKQRNFRMEFPFSQTAWKCSHCLGEDGVIHCILNTHALYFTGDALLCNNWSPLLHAQLGCSDVKVKPLK